MDFIEWVLENLIVFQVVTDLIKITIGAGLCFGALKWRRGLLTTTAVGWGLILGCLLAIPIGEAGGAAGAIICVLIGVILLPILTYTVPGVNRFILGFLVASKLALMVTTELAKAGTIDIAGAIIAPLIVGAVIGLVLMIYRKMRVSAFVLSCSFVGSASAATAISELIRRILFSLTRDWRYIFDPTELLFNLFKIELTDIWTLIAMVLLMFFSIRKQLKILRENGIPLDTPIIGFECPYEDNGKIYTDTGCISTMNTKSKK